MLHNCLNSCLDRLVGPRCLELKAPQKGQARAASDPKLIQIRPKLETFGNCQKDLGPSVEPFRKTFKDLLEEFEDPVSGSCRVGRRLVTSKSTASNPRRLFCLFSKFCPQLCMFRIDGIKKQNMRNGETQELLQMIAEMYVFVGRADKEKVPCAHEIAIA